MRIWGGATTTPRDLSTPSLNIGAGSFSRDRRNIAQYFSGARGRSRKGCCLWRSRTTMWPKMSFWRARESCCRFFACTIRSYSRHCAHSHSPSWNTTARTAYFRGARDLLPMLTTLSFSWWPTIRETPDGSPTGTHEGRGTAMKMTIEPVSAFSSLDVLVAMDEGLFRAEGLDLTMASRESRDIRSTTEGTLSSPVTNQGRLQERGEATMFQG